MLHAALWAHKDTTVEVKQHTFTLLQAKVIVLLGLFVSPRLIVFVEAAYGLLICFIFLKIKHDLLK